MIILIYNQLEECWERKTEIFKTKEQAERFVKSLIQGNGFCIQSYGNKFGATSKDYRLYNAEIDDELSVFVKENEQTFLNEGKEKAINQIKEANDNKNKKDIEKAIKLLTDNGYINITK